MTHLTNSKPPRLLHHNIFSIDCTDGKFKLAWQPFMVDLFEAPQNIRKRCAIEYVMENAEKSLNTLFRPQSNASKEEMLDLIGRIISNSLHIDLSINKIAARFFYDNGIAI